MRFSFFKRAKAVEVLPAVKYPTGMVLKPARVMPGHASVLRGLNGRMLRSVNAKMLRMFEAAVTNNLNTDFPVTISSANAEILVSIAAAKSRSRKLERDDCYAKEALEIFQDNIGGEDPFRLEMKIGKWDEAGEFIEETETNRLIEASWNEAGFPENCTTRRDMSRFELDMQVITSMIRDGGFILRHHRGFEKNVFGYAVEAIETDRLDHNYNRAAVDTNNKIQFSIEVDEHDGPVAFWLLLRHPGDVFAFSNQPKYRERVRAEDIIALWDIRTRGGQFISAPRLSTIIQHLHRNKQFDVAHVTAAIWSSCKPFFITQEFPTAMDFLPDFIKTQMQAAAEGGAEGETQSVAEPGTGEVLPWGQKPILMDPKFPIEAASGFRKDQLRAAAAGAGVPYYMLGQDLEGVNFSSGRLGLNQFQDRCKKLQKQLILNYRRPHFNTWLKYAILSGRLKGKGISIERLEEFQAAAKFYGRRWPYVNPLQDAQADILRIDAGLTSRSRVIAESDRGGDVEEVNAEIASDKACDESHGLNFSSEDQATRVTETTDDDDDDPEGGDGAAKTKKTPPNKPKPGGKQTIKGKAKKPS